VLGDRGSRRALEIGKGTRAGVIQVLGPPQRESADGRSIGYCMSYYNGQILWPLCFFTEKVEHVLAVRIDFDEHGVLVFYQFLKASYEDQNIKEFLNRIGPERPAARRTAPSAPSPTPGFEGDRYETVSPR
jgi:hypothetical protein